MSRAMTINKWPGTLSNITSQASFIVPVDTNTATLPTRIYLTKTGTLVNPQTGSNIFEASFRVPQWTLLITNRLQYFVIDRSVTPNRIIDFVNLDNLVSQVNVTKGMTGDTNAGGGGIFSDKNTGKGTKPGAGPALSDGDMWNPTHVSPANFDSPSLGVLNQIAVGRGQPYVGDGTWSSSNAQLADKQLAVQQFNAFLAGQLTNQSWQVPFTPSRRLYLRSSWEANDPLVHYTAEDLADPILPGSTNFIVQPLSMALPIPDPLLRKPNLRYRPWGGNPSKDPSNDPTAYNLTMKDPLIRRSDDWQFPTNYFANLGWIGRVHRGTPWQTMYLKSPIDPITRTALDATTWLKWGGNAGTHPTNDWRLLDLFTVAPNENAARGTLGVNQTNFASWAAVLGGITVTTNVSSDAAVGAGRSPSFQQMVVDPASVQMLAIAGGVTRTRTLQTNRVFRTIGEVLATPELTVDSPFLNRSPRQRIYGIDDAAYERIPQQVLSLLRTDEPRVAVYAFGQALKPADRSLVTVATVSPPIFNICTNYQVTGEYATKTVLRFEELPPEPTTPKVGAPVAQKMRAIVESYSVLQPQ